MKDNSLSGLRHGWSLAKVVWIVCMAQVLGSGAGLADDNHQAVLNGTVFRLPDTIPFIRTYDPAKKSASITILIPVSLFHISFPASHGHHKQYETVKVTTSAEGYDFHSDLPIKIGKYSPEQWDGFNLYKLSAVQTAWQRQQKGIEPDYFLCLNANTSMLQNNPTICHISVKLSNSADYVQGHNNELYADYYFSSDDLPVIPQLNAQVGPLLRSILVPASHE